MRTNIEIDDKLMRRALKASGAPTKKAAVEKALALMVQLDEQAKFRKLFGKIQWEGDLDAMRESRLIPWEEEPAAAKAPAESSGRKHKQA